MKRILALALVILSVMAVAIPAMAAEWRMGTVFGGQLAFRQTPSTSATRLAWIPNGTRLDCYFNTMSDEWFWTYFPVNGSMTNGYVMGGWILLDGTYGR